MVDTKDAHISSMQFSVQSADVETPGASYARIYVKWDADTGLIMPYMRIEDGSVLGPYQALPLILKPIGVIYTLTDDGVVGNTAISTSVAGTGEGGRELPADFLVDGRVIRVKAGGYYSTAGADTDIIMRFASSATVLADTGTITLPVSQADQWWAVEAELVCRAAGASGTHVAHGVLMYKSDAGSETLIAPLVNTSGITLDTTGTQTIDISVEWTTADASNVIRCQWMTIEVIR